MSRLSNCNTCKHKQHPDGGWCYMFRDQPNGVCAKHTPPAQDDESGCRCEPSDWFPPADYDGDGSVAGLARRAAKSRPAQQIGTIGHISEGKTTLTAAVAPFLKDQMAAQQEPTPEELVMAELLDTEVETYRRFKAWEKAQQEPVIRYDALHEYARVNGLDYNELCRVTRSAYTNHQAREWVWLTDEEIRKICDENFILLGDFAVDFIEAIEAKLKEKNLGIGEIK